LEIEVRYRSLVARRCISLLSTLSGNKATLALWRFQPSDLAIHLGGRTGEIMGLLVAAGMRDAVSHELTMLKIDHSARGASVIKVAAN
jgi:hypothetical protein